MSIDRQVMTKIAAVREAVEPDFIPARILEVELSRPLADIAASDPNTGRMYRRAQVLVRLHGQPLGVLEVRLDATGLSGALLARQIWSAYATAINAHLQQDQLPAISTLDPGGVPACRTPPCVAQRWQRMSSMPLVSIVVATRERPDSLRTTIESLLRLEYPDYEIIVVDNAPRTSATQELIASVYSGVDRVRYVREDRPGLSWARNRGLLEARGEIIAYTDDDVFVDPAWVTELVNGFAVTERVVCVTGLTLPGEIETPAQAWFEERGGFSQGFTRRIFDRDEHLPESPLHRTMYPYAAGIFGGGCNMAFKVAFLRERGGFDPSLGAGTPCGGGEDLAMFVQVIKRGQRLVYEPAALNYHIHRRDYEALKQQIYHYGVGLTALGLKYALEDPISFAQILLRAPYALVQLVNPRSQKNAERSASYPAELIRLELLGMLGGPLAYVRSRLRTRRLVRQFGPLLQAVR